MVEKIIDSPPEEREGIPMSAEEYMEKYAEHHYEWVKGVAYKMSPVTDIHFLLVKYLFLLFEAYFKLNPIGFFMGDPFVMRLDHVPSKRQPDVQIILHTNPGQFTSTAMIGPADICVEVVSPGSITEDYRDKFSEYQLGGVQEYWIIDPQKKECRFHRLQANGVYAGIPLDTEGNYTTLLLPHFKLHVATLWQSPLPDFFAIGEAVKAMFQA